MPIPAGYCDTGLRYTYVGGGLITVNTDPCSSGIVDILGAFGSANPGQSYRVQTNAGDAFFCWHNRSSLGLPLDPVPRTTSLVDLFAGLTGYGCSNGFASGRQLIATVP